ncbi:DUF1254 domain-containing protein [Dankookia sp. P2]|uniref:DUF1254 domain-containing protein n=1 Tax=Dankookia sp. P2 TaxID=3423955 RepID=UPI003D664765
MELTRRQSTNYARPGEHFGRGPANSFLHIREFPPADFRDVVRPNFDTLYSVAWLDLVREPIVLSVPDVGAGQGRYYLMPMLDMWTNVFASPGTRTTGTGEAHFAILPPGWSGSLPNGIRPIQAPTSRAWIIGRTQTNGAGDYATVHRQQDGYRLAPLSRWGQPPAPVTGTVDPAVDMRTPPSEQVNRMSPMDYFTLGAKLLKANPPGAYDQPILARMARIRAAAGRGVRPQRGPACPARVAGTGRTRRSPPLGGERAQSRRRQEWLAVSRRTAWASTVPTTCAGPQSPCSASALTCPRTPSIQSPRCPATGGH